MTLQLNSLSTTAATVKLLRKIKFLADVDEEMLYSLASSVHRRCYPANTALFHAGEPGHILFMVVSGWVRIQKVTATGTMVIGKRGPCSQLGELALFDGAPRMADAVTDTECELMTLERSAFLKCLAESPSASLAVMASLAEMVRSAGASLETFRSQDTRGRLAELLLRYCDSHGVPTKQGAIEICMKVTHQSLADEVGVTRETVSRSLGIIKKTGAIRTNGFQIVVLMPDKLRQMIDM
jgi:CRP/FNR family cyclic AMP-dependent transcriptional regulator